MRLAFALIRRLSFPAAGGHDVPAQSDLAERVDAVLDRDDLPALYVRLLPV